MELLIATAFSFKSKWPTEPREAWPQSTRFWVYPLDSTFSCQTQLTPSLAMLVPAYGFPSASASPFHGVCHKSLPTKALVFWEVLLPPNPSLTDTSRISNCSISMAPLHTTTPAPFCELRVGSRGATALHYPRLHPRLWMFATENGKGFDLAGHSSYPFLLATCFKSTGSFWFN